MMSVEQLMQKKKILEEKVLEEAKLKGQLEECMKSLTEFGCANEKELGEMYAKIEVQVKDMEAQFEKDYTAFAERLAACKI